MLKSRFFGVVLCWLMMVATLVVVPAVPTGAAAGDAPVTGAIHIDFDRDGLIDPGEAVSDTDPLFPPAGVTVNAYDAAGTSVACVVTTGTPPTYSCPVAQLAGSQFRVEFELDPADVAAGFAGAPSGADYGTSVQFVGPGDVANWATVPPSQCPTTGTGADGNANTSDGKLWTTCFVNGDRDSGGPQDVLVGLNYDRTGVVEKLGLKGDQDDATANPEELGSVWGLAYDQWSSTLFTSAFLKRHSQLGSQGVSGLYWIDYPSGAWNSVDLNSIGPSYGAPLTRDLEGVSESGTSYDIEAYDEVGSTGIGDIDVTPDGRTLLVTNLEAKTLEVYDISGVPIGGSPVWQQSVPVSNPGCADTVNTDDYEIFAVKSVDGDNSYVGVTCTARTSQDANDLAAFVVPVSLTAGQGAAALTVPLNYPHMCSFSNAGTPCGDLSWSPWSAPGVWFPANRFNQQEQPILSDLEITADGSLVLGFVDRSGHARGSANFSNDPTDTELYTSITAGDLLHACNTSGDPANPVWVLEGGAGSACDATPNGFIGDGSNNVADHMGPGGSLEWYGSEVFASLSGLGGHSETSLGGLYVNPYLDEVVYSAMDPLTFTAGGLEWANTSNGSEMAGYTLYEGDLADGYLGKAAGIGDVEGCFIPIEIGSFVWLDLDGDGVQDPGEDPLVGVTVTLYDAAGNVVATTVTDANGEYFFDSGDGVEANTAYTISFDVSTNTTPLPGGFTNADLSETIPDSTVTTANDANDSDVVNGDIAALTGEPGANDHTFDAGFTLPRVFDLALQKQLADGTNLAGVSPGDTVTFTITVTNQGNTNAENITVTDYLPASGLTLADPDWTDLGDGTAISMYPGPLAPGSSTELDITFTVDADASGQINNWAEISAADPTDGFGTIFTDETGSPIADVDSTPDADQAGDNQPTGPDATGDDVIDEDGLNGGDEDDHDVAGIRIVPTFDLALQKQLADGTNLGAVMPGDTVTFTITVINQGTAYAENMTVTDYLPASGLTLADPAWTDNGDGTAQIAIAGPLAPGGSTTVDIMFTVDAGASGQANNWAEISEATPTDGAGTVATDDSGTPLTDIDSTPDADPADDNQPTGPNDTTDDQIDEDGLNGGDEDDHDVAGVTIGVFDLALQKQLADGTNLGSASPGDSITFNIEVFNQGTVDATDIVVTDYTPAGLTLADAAWTDNGDSTATSPAIAGPIAPGDSVVLTITYSIDADAAGTLVNWAEISWADDDGDPSTPAPTDIDSTPNADSADDNQPSGPNATGDDVIDEDGLNGGDEDDHDPAGIMIIPIPDPVFDLALQKQLADGTNLAAVAPGDSVTFTITVFNQGALHAEHMTVTDYLPATGLTLADADWTDNGDGTADIAIAGPLAPGTSATVDITFTVDADASGQINNIAEISAAIPTDGSGNTAVGADGTPIADVDSIPDADPTGDNQPTGPNATGDDVIDEDGLNGGDEDDHDIAGITVTPPPEDTHSVGNQVWFDDNNNGIADPGEAPIGGVWVELFTDTDGDGQPDDLNGDGVIDVNDAIATTGTDADGNYLFDGLAPGDYIVGIPPMEWDIDGPLYGYLSSDSTSNDPNDDVDNDDNGFPGPGGYVWSGPVTLGDGEPTGEVNDNDPNTPDGNENLTVDFGFYQPVFDLALFKQLADGSNLASVGRGDEVTFTLSIVNQGTVDAANLTIVDYLPAGLTLVDADWADQSDGTATIQVAGPIAAGATATVDITFTVNADATGNIDNWAEIGAATPVDVLGKTITMPNGDVLPDIDSIADSDNSDVFTDDDSVDGSGMTGGDEDDHDRAQLQINTVLAFTGSSSAIMVRLALSMLIAGAGAILLAGTTRRRRNNMTA